MHKIHHKETASELGLFLATLIWGCSFVVVKNTTHSISPGFLIFFRFAIATVCLWTVFFRRIRELNWQYLKWGIFIGFTNFLGFELQTYGVERTTTGKNAFLTSAYCVVVPFLYWLFKKDRPSPYHIVSAAVCMVGIGFSSLEKDFSVNPGDILSLLCGLVFAVQIVVFSILTEKSDPILLCMSHFAATALITLPVACLTETFPSGFTPGNIVSLLYLGIFSTSLAFVLQLISQKYMPPSKTSLILSLESVFGTLCGILFLQEHVTPKLLIGFLLIFSAILLAETEPSLFRFLKHMGFSGKGPSGKPKSFG